MTTKSNLILGMGETTEEIIDSLQRLRDSGCDIITITQYLRPSKLHHPIDRWVKPEEFLELSRIAEEMGFLATMAGPMVRSSRSEEHTSELQSRGHLVCRLLLEK